MIRKLKERKKERERLHEEKMKQLKEKDYIPLRKLIFNGTIYDPEWWDRENKK